MFEVFKRRSHDVNRRKFRMETKQIYEDECNRLVSVVEHLTKQRKESVETIRLVNSGLSGLINSLQKKNPPSDVPPIPNELLNTMSAQLLNEIQAQLELDGELMDDNESDIFVEDNEESIRRHDDDGLKTELVILQSQMNRLRTEQDKLALNLERQRKQKHDSGNGESSNHFHKRKISTGLIDTFNLSKESLIDSDVSELNTEKDDDTYVELIKKQEKEITKLRQKIKIYENQFKEYTSMNGTANGNHSIDLEGTNEIKDEFKKLQRSFHTITSVSDNEMEIKKEEANELLESYNLGSSQDNSKSLKTRLAAAAEAQILSKLNDEVENYFTKTTKDTYLEQDYDDDNLELDLVETTEKLVELLNRFTNVRANGDESLKETCIKIRSLIYSSLSQFSFNSEDDMHPFITLLESQLLKFMETYRSSTELSQAKEVVKQIIFEFISLVYFKLKSLDPQPKLAFYEQGANVDEHKMKGAWDKTDLSSQEVEICYFPAVIVNPKNSTRENTISKAQVLTRRRHKSTTQI